MRPSIFAGLDRDVDFFFCDDAQLTDLFDQAFEFRHIRGCCRAAVKPAIGAKCSRDQRSKSHTAGQRY